MERLARLGFSARSGRNEFHCHLCHVLDDDRLFPGRLRPPLRQRLLDRRADLPACAAGLRGDAAVLVHSVLDVPAEDFSEDLRGDGAEMTITELLLAELDREAVAIRKALERVPEGKNDWKP